MQKQYALIEAMSVDHPTLDQRELIGSYIEGMVGISNAYCMSSEDLQTLARYVWAKTR